ncbi:hypothetical protein [Sphingopyxis terrae]|uniref:hypothetical protein n=1 Tax=Sphingopyxis terrae TaxID=33052 RepID=UPI001934A8E1|nr:hypothetical protein [Sphingopyxis terrae]
MTDGPLDGNKGGFFESQKGISDRRAARGIPPDVGRNTNSSDGGNATGGGGNLIPMLLFGALWLLWKVVELLFPILLALAREAAKLTGQLIMAAMSRKRR